MTTVLRGDATEIVLSRPGLYLVSGDGSCGRIEHPSAAAVVLAVHLLGDFIASAHNGREVLVNNRLPLGRLQRLRNGDVIEIRRDHVGGAEPSSRLRLVYGCRAPAIRFVLPATAPVRCQYTLSPLAGAKAVRCGQCFGLYGCRAWTGELGESCPHCGWPHEETSQ